MRSNNEIIPRKAREASLLSNVHDEYQSIIYLSERIDALFNSATITRREFVEHASRNHIESMNAQLFTLGEIYHLATGIMSDIDRIDARLDAFRASEYVSSLVHDAYRRIAMAKSQYVAILKIYNECSIGLK